VAAVAGCTGLAHALRDIIGDCGALLVERLEPDPDLIWRRSLNTMTYFLGLSTTIKYRFTRRHRRVSGLI
jgi:hypothetical protein